jgi:hypothetical protein
MTMLLLQEVGEVGKRQQQQLGGDSSQVPSLTQENRIACALILWTCECLSEYNSLFLS